MVAKIKFLQKVFEVVEINQSIVRVTAKIVKRTIFFKKTYFFFVSFSLFYTQRLARSEDSEQLLLLLPKLFDYKAFHKQPKNLIVLM